MKKTNIQERLNRQRNKFISGEELLEDIKTIIAEDDAKEAEIHDEITRGIRPEGISNGFQLDLLDAEMIYH